MALGGGLDCWLALPSGCGEWRMVVRAEFPGAELVEKGLADLAEGTETVESLLVSVGAPRLRDLGFPVRAPFEDP